MHKAKQNDQMIFVTFCQEVTISFIYVQIFQSVLLCHDVVTSKKGEKSLRSSKPTICVYAIVK